MSPSDDSTPDDERSAEHGDDWSEDAGGVVGLDDERGEDVSANATEADVPAATVRPALPPHSVADLAAEPTTRCLNCDADLPGPFCPACGQRAEQLRQPVHLFLRDAVAELFGLDGRVWRTLGTLLVKPGTLTRAYLEGRRRRYLTPLRVYLVATLSFFVLLSLLDPTDTWIQDTVYTRNGEPADTLVAAGELAQTFDAELARIPALRAARDSGLASADAVRLRALAEPNADSIHFAARTGQTLDDTVLSDADREELVDEYAESALDSLEVPSRDDELRMRVMRGIVGALPPDKRVSPPDIDAAASQIVPDVNFDVAGSMPAWLQNTRAMRQFADARTSDDATEASRVLIRSAIGQIPTVFFLLLPLYALLLKLLYVRRDWFYAEHLVFALHVHAFTFLVGALVLLVAATGEWGAVTTTFYTVAGLSIPVYFVIAQKRVYRQLWLKTLAKALLLGPTYAFLLVTAGIVLTLALAVVRG